LDYFLKENTMKFIRSTFTAALLLASTSTLAGELTCGGTVETLGYHANDVFIIKLSSMNTPVIFCNSTQTWSVPGTDKTTSPESCRMLYSTFLSAQAMKKSIDGMLFDGAAVPTDCNNWPAWAHTNIRYFTLNQ
jgi:hypothetical protein